jgi:hypothetical protein
MAERKEEVRRKLRERAVPASAFGRAAGFARLGASLVYGTMSDSVSRYFRGPPPGEAPAADGVAPNRCAPLGRRGCAREGAAARKRPDLLSCRRCLVFGKFVIGRLSESAVHCDDRRVIRRACMRSAAALTQVRKAAKATWQRARLAAGRVRSRWAGVVR